MQGVRYQAQALLVRRADDIQALDMHPVHDLHQAGHVIKVCVMDVAIYDGKLGRFEDVHGPPPDYCEYFLVSDWLNEKNE
jgi:hypothetical protein